MICDHAIIFSFFAGILFTILVGCLFKGSDI